MKKKLRKAIAVLVIAANMVGLCAPAYAEETNTAADEREAVTIYFDEPIVLSLEESYAGSEAEEDGGVMPCGDVAFEYIPEIYWGTYITDDYNYYVSIKSNNHVTFRGKWIPDYGQIFCNGDHIKSVYWYAPVNKTSNFSFTYSQYTKVRDTQNVQVGDDITITGTYYSSNSSIKINSVTYYIA